MADIVTTGIDRCRRIPYFFSGQLRIFPRAEYVYPRDRCADNNYKCRLAPFSLFTDTENGNFTG